MNLVKWHGLGNDYLLVGAWAAPIGDVVELARRLSDRRRGPGADGLIVLGPASRPDADLRMTILNADGSDGGVCGNGLRCAAAWVVSEGLVPASDRHASPPGVVRIETPAGVSVARVEDGAEGVVEWTVSVDMPSPDFRLQSIPAEPPGWDGEDEIVGMPLAELAEAADLPPETGWSLVSTGNPHLVAWCETEEAIDRVRLETIGPRLERHAWFPRRINTHVAAITSDRIRMRTWERGSGPTTACGTGACAVVASLVRGGRLAGSDPHRVSLPGGDLEIAWAGGVESPIRMTGEAVRVCGIEVDDRWIDSGRCRERRVDGGTTWICD